MLLYDTVRCLELNVNEFTLTHFHLFQNMIAFISNSLSLVGSSQFRAQISHLMSKSSSPLSNSTYCIVRVQNLTVTVKRYVLHWMPHLSHARTGNEAGVELVPAMHWTGRPPLSGMVATPGPPLAPPCFQNDRWFVKKLHGPQTVLFWHGLSSKLRSRCDKGTVKLLKENKTIEMVSSRAVVLDKLMRELIIFTIFRLAFLLLLLHVHSCNEVNVSVQDSCLPPAKKLGTR